MRINSKIMKGFALFIFAFSIWGTFSMEIAHAADEFVLDLSISEKNEDLLQSDTIANEECYEAKAIFDSLKQKKRYEDVEEVYYEEDEDEEYVLGDIQIGKEYVIKKANIRSCEVFVYNLTVNKFLPKDIYIMFSFSEGSSTEDSSIKFKVKKACRFFIEVETTDGWTLYKGTASEGIPDYSVEIIENLKAADVDNHELQEAIREKTGRKYDDYIIDYSNPCGTDLYRFVEDEEPNCDIPNLYCGVVSNKGKVIFVKELTQLGNYYDGIAIAQKKDMGKWGFIDTKGKWVGAPKYKRLEPWIDGEKVRGYIATYDDRMGVTNKTGKFLWSKAGITDIQYWMDDCFLVTKKDGVGLISKKGKWVWYKKGITSIDGITAIRSYEISGKYCFAYKKDGAGVINIKNGKWKWYKKGIKRIEYWNDKVYVGYTNQNSRYNNGILDAEGNWLLEPEYNFSWVNDLSDNDYIELVQYNDTPLKNVQGRYVWKDEIKDFDQYIGEYNKTIQYRGRVYSSGKVVMDKKPYNTRYRAFHENRAVFSEEKYRYGYFSSEMYHIYCETRYGVIDSKGKIIVEDKYLYIKDYASGAAAVYIYDRKKGRYVWGFIDKNGKEIVPLKYTGVEDFVGNYAIVRNQKNECELINKKGETLLKGRRIVRVGDYYWVEKKGKCDIYNNKLKKISSVKSDKIYYDERFVQIEKISEWGKYYSIMKPNGKIILEEVYNKPIYVEELDCYVADGKLRNSKDEIVVDLVDYELKEYLGNYIFGVEDNAGRTMKVKITKNW